jgi:hypothetical protein
MLCSFFVPFDAMSLPLAPKVSRTRLLRIAPLLGYAKPECRPLDNAGQLPAAIPRESGFRSRETLKVAAMPRTTLCLKVDSDMLERM